MPKTAGKNKEECRVFLPPKIVEAMDEVVEEGMYNSRSELLRSIVRRWYRETTAEE